MMLKRSVKHPNAGNNVWNGGVITSKLAKIKIFQKIVDSAKICDIINKVHRDTYNGLCTKIE